MPKTALDEGSVGSMRVGRWMARAGLCSRREAETWIAEGRVAVDGRRLTHPACLVADPGKIRVDGQSLPRPGRARLWCFHKPRRVLVTHRDPRNRPTLFEMLPPELPRLVSVGRLDFDSEGLILLTNDGGLAGWMAHPGTGWIRRYRVRVRGRADPRALADLKTGITVSGLRYGSIMAKIDSYSGANSWLTMSLSEGKNREIRRVLGVLGLEVNRLIRVAYGPFQLGKLASGALRNVPAKVMREQLGSLRGQP